MTDPTTAKVFLQGEVAALRAFDFVAAYPAGKPLDVVEVLRTEENGLEVRVPGRPRVVPALDAGVRQRLLERGFESEDPADPGKPWVKAAADEVAAVDLVQELLRDVFGAKPDAALDVAHGSHLAEHEARVKLAAVRERIERELADEAGQPPEQDSDGDYVLPVRDVHVIVSPRIGSGAVVVRIFAITNVNVTIGPELGLFLARLNFSLMFGRFALDVENRAIWVDETLLGAHFTDDELRSTVEVVATIADEWDDRLKQMFGGVTHQEALAQKAAPETPTVKPGHGMYL